MACRGRAAASGWVGNVLISNRFFRMSEYVGLSMDWLRSFAKEHKVALQGKSSLQVFEFILKPALTNKYGSYTDLLKSHGASNKDIARATSFVSHEWSCSFTELLTTLDEWCEQDSGDAARQDASEAARNHFLWIDLFASGELKTDDAPSIKATMPDIGSNFGQAVIVLSPHPHSRYLFDARCRLELHAAYVAGIPISVLLPRTYRSIILASMRETGDVLDPTSAGPAPHDHVCSAAAASHDKDAVGGSSIPGGPAIANSVSAVLRGWAAQLALEAAGRAGSAGPDPDCRLRLLCGAGGLLWGLGRVDEARAAYAACLREWDAGLGGGGGGGGGDGGGGDGGDSEHVDALVTRNRLAVACGRMGREADARRLHARGVAARRVRIGDALAVTGEGGSLRGWLRQAPAAGGGPRGGPRAS